MGVDYWAESEDKRFPIADWQREVAEGETRHGYHDWIKHRRGIKRQTAESIEADQDVKDKRRRLSRLRSKLKHHECAVETVRGHISDLEQDILGAEGESG